MYLFSFKENEVDQHYHFSLLNLEHRSRPERASKICVGYFYILYKNNGEKQWLGMVMGLKEREVGKYATKFFGVTSLR